NEQSGAGKRLETAGAFPECTTSAAEHRRYKRQTTVRKRHWGWSQRASSRKRFLWKNSKGPKGGPFLRDLRLFFSNFFQLAYKPSGICDGFVNSLNSFFTFFFDKLLTTFVLLSYHLNTLDIYI